MLVSTSLNIAEVLIADGMGIVLSFFMLLANIWKLKEKNKENRALLWMIIAVMFSCFADIIAFTFDGKPGRVFIIGSYIGNMWLYASNIIVMPIWLRMIISHINGVISKQQRIFIWAICGIGTLLLVLNFFVPLVFTIDENNVYTRGPLFIVFIILELFVIFDGVGAYAVAKKRGGILKFFPVWQFIVPILIGIIIQSLVYGVATIWPFVSISLVGLLVNLQNETVCYDKLTGLYNRYYLDSIKREIQKKTNREYTVIMLDMNGFKSINDRFGHSEGDNALIETAGILKRSVGSLGSIIRYAGDEFIIVLNTIDEKLIEECIESIKAGMRESTESVRRIMN